MDKLMIIGASGHGKVVADIALCLGYKDIVFFDDDPSIINCGGYPVVGGCDEAFDYDGAFIVAIGNSQIREKILKKLEKKEKKIVTLIHPNAVLGRNVSVGDGTVVMAGAVINPDTIIGRGCIINTCASVDHDNIIEDFVHVSVGAHLAGAVVVREHTWIGIGAVVSNNLEICRQCLVRAGAVVVKDLLIPGIYEGVPARLKQ